MTKQVQIFVLTLIVIALTAILSCSKTSSSNLTSSSPDSLYQSIIYKTVATVPSPADTTNGLLKDSLNVSRKVYKSTPDFFSNISFVAANIEKNNFTGFSFGYDNSDKSFPYFAFTAFAFPNVPREFLLNTPYENSTVPGTTYQRPLFLGSHTGNDGMTYFVNNVYPPDAGFPISKTYTNVVFTNKIKVPIYSDTALYGSGHIVGYCIDYYNSADTLKYKHQWNFTVDFTNLKIDF